MKNEGLFDRILRIIFGVGFFVFGYIYFENGWNYLFYFLGLILLITGLTGYCGLYNILHISTIKKKEKKEKKFIGEKKEAGM
ncbi:MAG TPA: DUF2892 domain-containing protein [Candidatus Nanoarchaeia archaeon]|nr:DUF2892 domain-containing protein [Candidatus Nanoarchaeia archaeon]